MILGEPGAGKTIMLRMFQYAASAAQNRQAFLRGREKNPVYVPLNHYDLFLKTRLQAMPAPGDANDLNCSSTRFLCF